MEYGQTDTEAGVDLSPVGTLELLFDPYFYVGSSVSEMSTDSESGWSLPPVSPLVERARWNSQVLGEILDGQEPFSGFHRQILP